jgi:2-aminoethylphosphonate-pyruvate transaminase
VLAPRRQVLFNPGPVNLDPAVKESLFNVELCHRQPEFAELRDRVVERLHGVAGLGPETHRLSLLHGSGALAVDAALASLVRGRTLVVLNGLYCERIGATLRGLGVDVVEHDCGIGVPPDPERLEREIAEARPDWVACVQHETTTGLLNPLGAIADAAEAAGARLFVDAVSSFAAHPLDPRADVVCFNANKCLESLPGIAGVFWREGLELRATVPVLDVGAYADGIPATPNVQAFVALDVALDLLAAEDRPARYERLARHVWRSGSRSFEPLLPEPHRSHVLTSFRLGGRDPDELNARALAAGFVIYHGQRHLRDEIFRVANMGAAMSEDVIDELFGVLAA